MVGCPNGTPFAVARVRLWPVASVTLSEPVPIRVERTVDPDWAGDPLAAAALMLEPLPLRVVEDPEDVRDAAAAEVRRAWRSPGR